MASFLGGLAEESAGNNYTQNLINAGLPVLGNNMNTNPTVLADSSIPSSTSNGLGTNLWDRFNSAIGADGEGGLFGMNKDTMGSLGKLGTLAGGLADSFMAYKQMGLAEDAFNFNKDMAMKEYNMTKDAYDRNVKRAKSIGDQMRAGGVGG